MLTHPLVKFSRRISLSNDFALLYHVNGSLLLLMKPTGIWDAVQNQCRFQVLLFPSTPTHPAHLTTCPRDGFAYLSKSTFESMWPKMHGVGRSPYHSINVLVSILLQEGRSFPQCETFGCKQNRAVSGMYYSQNSCTTQPRHV